MRMNVLGKSVDLALRWVEAGGSLGLAGFLTKSITAPGSEQDLAVQTNRVRGGHAKSFCFQQTLMHTL